MSNTNKRIIDLETKQTLGSGDYLAADSEQGTYKVDADTNIVKPLTGLIDNDFANGAVNLLAFDFEATKAVNVNGTWNGNVYTINGATFTLNTDGTVTKSGTPSETTQLYMNYISLPAGTYKLVGCPAGGDYGTYDIRYTNSYVDFGNGVSFTLASTTDNIRVALTARANNATVIYKPMITVANMPNSDYAHYVPYAKSNKDLTDDIIPLNNSVADSNDAYDSTKAYKVGDMVIHDDILYICTTACSAASWAVNSACFTAKTLASVVTQLNSDLIPKNIWNTTDFTANSVASSLHRTVTLCGKHIFFNYYYRPSNITTFNSAILFTLNKNEYVPALGADIYGTAWVCKSTSNETVMVPIRLHKDGDDGIWRIQGTGLLSPSNANNLDSNSFIGIMLEWDIA